MKNTFKLKTRHRFSPFVMAAVFAFPIYGFIYEAYRIESLIGSIFCIIFASLLLAIPIILAKYLRTIIVCSDQGLFIKALFKSTFIPWEEIIEYGKFRKVILLRRVWCYYVRRVSNTKKIIIGLEYFVRFRVLNNIIIRNATGAKLNNTHHMQLYRE